MTGIALYESTESRDNNNFINEYTPLVKRIAHHLISRLPSSIQVDDLIQAGMIGLIEAYRNFDDSKGASFTTYAGIRIRGAMLDEIRKGDWAPRSVHRNSRMIAQAIKAVEDKKGSDAREHEIAEHLEISLSEYRKILNDANKCRIFAFEDLGITEDVVYSSIHQSATNPFDRIQKDKFKQRLAQEVQNLPERERIVLALYYDEELNLREVGEVLNVSESRISQIHSQAMCRLQGRMRDWSNG